MTDSFTKKQPKVLAVNDMSCYGKCSLTVALPILSSLNIEAVPLPTAVLSTHTGGKFKDYTRLDMTDEMEKTVNHFLSMKLKFDCVYTGYFVNDRQLETAKLAIKQLTHDNSTVIIDPVMADNGKLYTGFERSYAQKMRSLCTYADIITPNITEASLLADIPYKNYYNKDELDLCIERLFSTGCKKLVITGVKTEDGKIGFVCADKERNNRFEIFYPAVDKTLYGCGDVFASMLCGLIAKGTDFEKAVRKAAFYMNECINATLPEIDTHWYGLKFEQVDTKEIFQKENI